jgi:hypothetical protein
MPQKFILGNNYFRSYCIGKVCHAIDVMHVEKNVSWSLVGTLLYIPGKTKDTLKAWMDIEDMKLRKDFHHKIFKMGPKKLPTTCYTLSKQEKYELVQLRAGIKVLSGYSSNVSTFVNMKALKVCFKKSHDYHMLMLQLLAVAIRGILPDKV